MGKKITGYKIQVKSSGGMSLELLLRDGSKHVFDEELDERLHVYHIAMMLESFNSVYIEGLEGNKPDLSKASFHTRGRKNPTFKEAFEYECAWLRSWIPYLQKKSQLWL